jgi:hypothetical protein
MKYSILILIVLIAFSCQNASDEATTNEIDSSSIAENNVPAVELDTNCIFNQETQNDSFMVQTGIKDYTWDYSQRTATHVAENGDTLKFQRGGCDNFTVGVWRVSSLHTGHKHNSKHDWINEALELADYLKDELNVMALQKAAANETYDLMDIDNGQMLFFNSEGLADMHYTIEKKSDENFEYLAIYMYMN